MMSTAYSKQTHSIRFLSLEGKKSNLTFLVTGQYTVVKDEIIGLKSGNKLCENSIYIGLSGNEEKVTLTKKGASPLGDGGLLDAAFTPGRSR